MGSGSKLLVPAIIATSAGVGLDMIGNTLANAYPDTPHWMWVALFWLSVTLFSGFPLWVVWRLIAFLFPRLRYQFEHRHHGYIGATDSPLGSAIRDMVRCSAWAKWFAAQNLVLSGIPAREEYLLNTACSTVWQKMLDGELVVRGRLPGKLDYEAIDRTHWHSTALTFIKDLRTLWKLIVIPTGGVEIEPSGTLHSRDPAATQRTTILQSYDSLLVDSRQFEALFPRHDRLSDQQRKKFLKQAKKRGLDAQEIKRLS